MGLRIATIVCLSCLTSAAHAAQLTANWLGTVGNWTDPSLWSTGIVPNNAANTYNVNIDNGEPTASAVTIPSNAGPDTITIGSLSIDAGDTLRVIKRSNGPYRMLNIQGPLLLNGTLRPESGCRVNVNDVNGITGSGAISLATPDFQPSLTSTLPSLTVGAGITVSSIGFAYGGFSNASIGDAGTFINKGRILANHGTLRVFGGTIDNQGVFEVVNGGTLHIGTNFTIASIGTLTNNGGSFCIDDTLDNTAQTLTVTRPREWLVGGTIRGGTIQASGNGSIGVDFLSSGTLDSVTLNSPIYLHGHLNIVNGISGNGTIIVSGGDLFDPLNVTLPTVPAGITIQGGNEVGTQGPSHVNLTTNAGTIRASAVPGATNAGELALTLPSGTITNTGSLEVTPGSKLFSDVALSFSGSGKLVVDGGGELSVTGDLSFASITDQLEVRPKTDGSAYLAQLIATYTGTRTGTFNVVTPGITVDYATPGQIRISGTPVPEPNSTAVLGVVASFALRPRRRRQGSREHVEPLTTE